MENKEDIEVLIWEYLDGKLSADKRKLLEEQLLNDQTYRTIFDEIKKLHTELQGLELQTPHVEFTSRVMEAVRVEKAEANHRRYLNKYVVGFICFLFLLCITLGVLLTEPQEAETTLIPALPVADSYQFRSLLHNSGPVIFFVYIVLAAVLVDKWIRLRELLQSGGKSG